jgi:hypothetical protein
MVLVDSSVWIEAARKDGDIAFKVGLEGLLDEYEAMWCGPVKLEVLGGARATERSLLERCFECVPYRPMDDSTWNHAKRNAWKMRDQGHTVPWNDIVIGTLSIGWACRVYAKDRHFEQMRDVLGIRLYSPGYGGSFAPESGG